MQYFYVKAGEIVGAGDIGENLPDDVGAIANSFGPGIDPNDYYVSDGSIQPKPDRPSPYHVWIEGGWTLPEVGDLSAIVNPWDSLVNRVRGSEVWDAAFTASFKSLRAQSAWSVLLSSLTSTHNIDDLAFGLNALIEAAPTLFSDEVKSQFKTMLVETNLLTENLSQILVVSDGQQDP